MHRPLAGASLLLAIAAHAQQLVAPAAAAHGAIVAGKDGLVLPAGEFSVVELVEATAAFLCRNYLYDPETLVRRGTFVLQRPLALDAPGSEELLAALLASRDLAAVPIDELRGVYQVLSLDSDPWLLATLPWRTPAEIVQRPRLRELIVTAIEVQNVDARALATAFRQHAWQPQAAHAQTFMAFASDEHLLLLRGYRDQLAEVVQVVRQLERANAPAPVAADTALRQRIDRLERELADLRAQLAVRDGTGR